MASDSLKMFLMHLFFIRKNLRLAAHQHEYSSLGIECECVVVAVVGVVVTVITEKNTQEKNTTKLIFR